MPTLEALLNNFTVPYVSRRKSTSFVAVQGCLRDSFRASASVDLRATLVKPVAEIPTGGTHLLHASQGETVVAEPLTQGILSSDAESARVLVVDDDEVLSRFLQRILSAEGFEVQIAHSGAAALQAAQQDVSIVVLDLNLPEMDGIAVLQALRVTMPRLPVLVLTARTRNESAVLALENGADDCLTKPFSYLELVARLRALLRRSATEIPPANQQDKLVLDRERCCAVRGERRVSLTPREFDLLERLLRTPGVPVARTTLMHELWGDDTSRSSNVVDVYMKYVRDKIDQPGLPRLIHTVRGVGYVVH